MKSTNYGQFFTNFGLGLIVIGISYLFFKWTKSILRKEGKRDIIINKGSGLSINIFKWYNFLSKIGIGIGILGIIEAFYKLIF